MEVSSPFRLFRRALDPGSARLFCLAVAMIVGGALAAGCDVGDQLCTPDSTLADKSDNCPYGPPGGPKPPVSDCADIPQKECATPITWLGDVYPIIGTVDVDTPGCGIATCHGDKDFFRRVFLPPIDPKAAYDALTQYEGSQKYPYVNASDPAHSWMLCNLEDPPGVGQVMPSPPGVITPEQIDIIREWLACGAQYDGGGSSSSGGGGGGAGGSGM